MDLSIHWPSGAALSQQPRRQLMSITEHNDRPIASCGGARGRAGRGDGEPAGRMHPTRSTNRVTDNALSLPLR
jgi:hypothetical protein